MAREDTEVKERKKGVKTVSFFTSNRMASPRVVSGIICVIQAPSVWQVHASCFLAVME